MRRLFVAVCVGIAAAWLPGPSAASDVPLRVFVDGRPLDRRGGSAIVHRGRVYVNVVRAVRAMNGLLTLGRAGEVAVTLDGRTAVFTVGRRVAMIDGAPLKLPGAPFLSDGDIFVPLATLAALGDSRLSVDARRRRATLVLGGGDVFPVASPRADDSEDVAPSPIQALAFVTTATADAAGLHAHAEITNTTAQPYVLNFPSARQFSFAVSRNGGEVWNSLTESADGVPTTVSFAPHETKIVKADWPGYARQTPGRFLVRLRLETAIPIDTTPVSLDLAAPSPAPTR